MKDIVAGLEMFCGRRGADDNAIFSYREYGSQYEVLMHFRGIRRFAVCLHENDAEVIVDALNNRKK